jgi:hypothetical protein
MMMLTVRDKLIAALAKPLPENENDLSVGKFDPWNDVIQGISGSYASDSDDLMIDALIACRDRTHNTFMTTHGFAGEFALYVLSGHGFTEYGTSPRYAWVDDEIADLWQPLIDKWSAYRTVVWA